jgi:hypothetical protein
MAGGRGLGPAAPAPATRGLDLGTIHELLHESTDAGVPRTRDKNDSFPKGIPDAQNSRKAPLVPLPAAEPPKLSVKSNEETIKADLDFRKKDSLRMTREARGEQDIQHLVPTDAPLAKTESPGTTENSSTATKPVMGPRYDSASNEKISTLTSNDTSDKKIFIFKEKALDEFAREEIADRPAADDVPKKDTAAFDSDSIDYSALDN